MSNFRKYGGMNYSANNNITKSHISNADNMSISNRGGQTNSKEIYASHIDMSGNSILHLGCLYFQDGTSMCGVTPTQDLLHSNNTWYGTNTFTNTLSAPKPPTGESSNIVPTTLWVNEAIGNLPDLLTSNNTWTGTNAFLDNVGIGTQASSTLALDIIGNIRISGTLSANSANLNSIEFSDGYVQSSPYTGAGPTLAGNYTNANISLDASGKITAISNGSDSLWEKSGINDDIYYNSGNVGIGTPSPTSLLTVAGNINSTGTVTAGTAIFNSATPPTSSQNPPLDPSNSTTYIPTTAWVQTAVQRLLGLSNTWTNTNIFNSTLQATPPAPTDNSQNVPTTSWVQTFVANFPGLSKNNQWTGTNTFSQNVGIGSLTTPTSALSVTGNITSTGTVTAGTAIFNSATPPTSSQNPPLDPSNSTTNMPTTAWVQTAVQRLLGLNNAWTGTNAFSSNVGIGTITPSYPLDVVGNFNINGNITLSGISNIITQTDTSSNLNPNNLRRTHIYGDVILYRPSTENGGAFRAFDVTNNPSGYSLQLYQSGPTTNLIDLAPNGTIQLISENTGGTQRKLITSRADSGTIIQTYNTDSTNNAQLRVVEADSGQCISFFANAGTSNYNYIVQNGDNVIFANKTSSTSYTENIVLTTNSTSNSGVRITNNSATIGAGGTSITPATSVVCDGTYVNVSPSLKFPDNTIQSSAYTGAGGLNGSYTNVNLTLDTNGKITAISSGSSGSSFWLQSGANDIYYSSGNVGIGTPTPTTALSVAGSITATGTITASSDYRIKDDVKSLNLSEYSIDKLNPVTFNFKDNGKKSIGLIAHELQEHYPFLVEGEKDGEQIQSVNYIGLIGVLIKEVQELKKQLMKLELQIK